MMRKSHGMNGCLAALVVVLLSAGSALAEQPTGKEIGDVVVQGNRIRTTPQILAKMNTKPGTRFDDRRAQEDVGRLIAEGWFPTNGVQLMTQDRSDGKITV